MPPSHEVPIGGFGPGEEPDIFAQVEDILAANAAGDAAAIAAEQDPARADDIDTGGEGDEMRYRP